MRPPFRPTARFLPLPALLFLLGGSVPLPAQQPLKVHISVDMEGIAGVVGPEQLGPSGFEYQRAREFMTGELLAAIEGARAAGATEILVADSHGNGQNLLIDRIPADIMVVRSWPRSLGMMAGLDSSFAAAVFIGYHSSTASLDGVRAHTMSSANYAGLRLNGVEVPEGGWNAAIAAHFGVPVVMVSGDEAAVAELRTLLGDVEGAVVKRPLGFHAAVTMTPDAARSLIRDRVRSAIGRLGRFRPWRQRSPVTVDLTFKNYQPAQVLAMLPWFQRTTAHAVRFQARDMVEASNIMEFISRYEPGLAP
ncbi:MAG TPA: M55 family metallopeptidase [Gemmatimonadales bacterium]|nr:M55 family metallopeptidase [Gemmatimonadales bacterium]